jgi:hypothetical protein
MAYPTVSAPYGLRPVNLIGGQVFAGSTRKLRIASGYNTGIFFGDLVTRTTDGTIVKATSTTTGPATGFVGVFLGCEYINTATNQPTFAQYFPANTAVTSGFITAYVADDPDQLFQVAVVSGTTVISGVQYSAIGENATLVQNAGSTVTGDSFVAILDSTATTRTLPVRIVDVVPDTAYQSGANVVFPEVIVKINAVQVDGDGLPSGGHAYNNPLGV